MVSREEFTPDLEEVRQAITGATIARRPDGGWILIVNIAGRVRIDDSRALDVVKEVRVRGSQAGRKTNAGSFQKGAKK